jgi:hypothetical protein
MLLHLEKSDVPMRLVFRLEDELQQDPKQVELAQALTLNASKPQMGLKGTHGLFGSPEWWKNIREGKIPLLFLSGVILRTYVAGQDEEKENNTVDLKLDDGSERAVGIYVNNNVDVSSFRVGKRASIVYALDELKRQPAANGGVNYSQIALEMAVQTD